VDRRRKRIAAIGAAVTLAVAGGGAAYAAATGGQSQRDAIIRDAAQRLNVTPDRLRSALDSAAADQLDQAVKDGRLTRQQADSIKQRIRQDGLPLGPGPGPGFGRGFGPDGPGHGPLRIGLYVAARYLGLTPQALRRDLAGGKTLAQVARDQGKSVDGLEQALVGAARARLDRAVSDGRLTSAQRDDILRGLQQHVGDLVNGRLPRPGLRRWRDGGPGVPGPGIPPGPPPGP
jgi:hypothetical protein